MFFILTLSSFRPLDFSISSPWLFLCPSKVLLCSVSPYMEAAPCFWSSLLSLLLLSPFSDVRIRAAFSIQQHYGHSVFFPNCSEGCICLFAWYSILNWPMKFSKFFWVITASFDPVVFMYLEYFLLFLVFIDILRSCVVSLKCTSSLTFYSLWIWLWLLIFLIIKLPVLDMFLFSDLMWMYWTVQIAE